MTRLVGRAALLLCVLSFAQTAWGGSAGCLCFGSDLATFDGAAAGLALQVAFEIELLIQAVAPAPVERPLDLCQPRGGLFRQVAAQQITPWRSFVRPFATATSLAILAPTLAST